jgi:ferrous iron transport protein A
MMISITDFTAGDRVRLLDFGQTDLSYRRKLLSLGLTRGSEMLVVRKAPLGCPVEVLVRGTLLALRKEEASSLVWERL